MTTLSEFLESLSYIELSDMSGASEGDGVVSSQWRNRIISILNQGLNTLHSEFTLKTGEKEIYASKEKDVHNISSPDFIRIDKISYDGDPLYINDTTVGDPRIEITGWDTIETQGFDYKDPLILTYRAKCPPLTQNTPGEYLLPIPARFEELLRTYVAWHIFTGYKDQAFSAKAAESRARYGELLQELREMNITNENNPELPNRWFDKGWGLTPPSKLNTEN